MTDVRVMRVTWAAVAAIVLSVGLLAGCAGIGGDDASSTGSGSGDAAAPAGSGGAGGAGCGAKVQTMADVERLISEPAGCPGAVNTFWRGELGDAWTPPRFVPYRDGEIPQDACGAQVNDADAFADNALYCSLDDTVAYSTDFMAALTDQGGPTYPMFVLMHELSHRANRIGNTVGAVSRAEENQADCFAGRQARAAHDAGRLPGLDIVKGGLLFFSLGDSRGGWFDREVASAPDAHGTPRQRAQAFGYGYLRGSDTCHRLGRSSSGSVLF